MKISKQKGFTLVEIAIVLVIIGLLLGGILKGQELINSARVRNLADQNSGVQAAYYGFIDRYRQVPGDWSASAATTAIGQTINSGGDGDGRIDVTDSFVESGGVWEQLSKAGFISGNYVGSSDEATYRANAPVNAFNGAVLLKRTTDYAGTAPERLAFMFGEQIPVSIMRELDVKLDDGVPTTGVLRFVDPAGSDGGNEVYDSASATCVNGGDWDIAANSQDCTGVFLY